MNKLLAALLLLISNGLLAQNVKLFNEKLNEFQNLRDFCISQNHDEVFFTVQSPNQDLSQIAFMKKTNGNWSRPELLPFCDEHRYLEPFLSYDGTRLYFVSDRPLNDSITVRKDFDIWHVTRNGSHDKWSEPINMGRPVNSTLDEFYPTLSNNNNLYLTIDAPSGLGKDDIYYCRWDGEKYSKPVLLNNNINSSGYEFNAFISKDESFLIYTKYNADDGFGSGDLYIARKDISGEWQQAKNLDKPVNTPDMEYCPFYDGSNKTLYFTSRRNKLESRRFKNLKAYQSYISSGENGLSRIFQYKIELNKY